MSQTAMPTGLDLQERLVAAGIVSNPLATSETFTRYDLWAGAAKADWEKRTGRVPFVVDAADATRYYDPPGPHARGGWPNAWVGGSHLLELDNGLVSCTSLTIGYSPSAPGTVLTVNVGYWLKPVNAALNGRPSEWIEFSSPQWGYPRSIVIVGKWGYPSVPDDVFGAVLDRALALALTELGAMSSGGMSSVALGLDKFTFAAGGAYDSEVKRAMTNFEQTSMRYTRQYLG